MSDMVAGWIVSISVFVVCGCVALVLVQIINDLDRVRSTAEDVEADSLLHDDHGRSALSGDDTAIGLALAGAVESHELDQRPGNLDGIEDIDSRLKTQSPAVNEGETSADRRAGPDGADVLEETVHSRAAVETVADFPTARARLFATPPDLVVTNLRLGAFNALHFAYLLASVDWPSRAVVYSESLDVSLSHEARRAGAFWELQRRLPHALPAYLDADLPARARRGPVRPDRWSAFRRGRRASDIAGLTSDASEIGQQSPPVRRAGKDPGRRLAGGCHGCRCGTAGCT